jgi:hypothetical protein
VVAIVSSQAIEITNRIRFLNIYLTTLWWDIAVRRQHLAAKVENGMVFQKPDLKFHLWPPIR